MKKNDRNTALYKTKRTTLHLRHLRVLEGILELSPEVVHADVSQLLEQAGEVVVSPPLVLVLAGVPG